MVASIKELRTLTREQFSELHRISSMLSAAQLPENLIEDSLDLVVDVLHAERAAFVRFNKEENTFKIISARNTEKENIADFTSFSSGILQHVIDKKQACLYHDVQSDPGLSQFESVQIQEIKSVIGVPVFNNGIIWGVILADSRKHRQEFTNENLLFLEFFANLLSLVLNKILLLEKLQNENTLLRSQLESAQNLPDIIGESTALKNLAVMIRKVARTDATVLLLGESGTGKDLAAKAIHKLSTRHDKPFLAQFCGSIPDTLLESELFGYKKGAFTGASTDKKGLFEVADQGTFFLDEVADISMALQAKLLRVIENKEIIRLGDSKVKKVDIRLIAATNVDLMQRVREGRFRQDLFYRLNVFPVIVPPLRQRRSDIPILVNHFIKKDKPHGKGITHGALKKLEQYEWPGNIRQLENTIKRALILAGNDRITDQHILLEESEVNKQSGTLKEIEQQVLRKRLEEFNGNRTQTAKSLGVSVRWIQLKLKEIENSE
ncbi:MAG: sigma 54-interacting transcriptional regulator [Calditrichaceae bacterium]|nr:sigma 54-interacting transcriptional regulator [Calditrichaceae bacterium]MBN2708026.1 sigma 54-interacting transcriptional regulator [Calditrichaceae bacterium]RQV93967.1 MAG: GAF domain-containing protein [Calditrichota bacterium]